MTHARSKLIGSLGFSDLASWDATVISKYGGYEGTCEIQNAVYSNGQWRDSYTVMKSLQLANARTSRALLRLYCNNPKRI